LTCLAPCGQRDNTDQQHGIRPHFTVFNSKIIKKKLSSYVTGMACDVLGLFLENVQESPAIAD